MKKSIAASDHTIIEPIETQSYNNGQAITPLPVVFFREKGKPNIKLEFTTDYYLSYKQNKEAGMASLTIHGKGKYKGKKSVVFIIEKK